MRTNIILDDSLIQEAFKYTNVSTKQELIEHVLREFVAHHRRRNLRELQGKVKLRADYDYKKLREEME